MKRHLISAAIVAAASSGVLAQSSVTVFGAVDATVSSGRGSVANKTQLTNSGYASSALGFRGEEDLGGGISAGFWLEAGLANDDGRGGATNTNNQASGNAIAGIAGGQGLTFNRRSTVSLKNRLGELRLGRDYTAHYWNNVSFDPFKNKGIGTSQAILSSLAGDTAVRASNIIGYVTPDTLSGFYGQYQHFLGENSSGTATENDGNGDALRVGYEAGPINTAIAVGILRLASGDVTTTNVGGSYAFKVATVMALYNRDSVARGKTGSGWLLGTSVPIGVGQIRAAYSVYATDAVTTPRTSKFALGYGYSLSKSTTLYATTARVHNQGTAAVALAGSVTAAGQDSTGYDLGISHKF